MGLEKELPMMAGLLFEESGIRMRIALCFFSDSDFTKK
jgi:hypothetical protein